MADLLKWQKHVHSIANAHGIIVNEQPDVDVDHIHAVPNLGSFLGDPRFDGRRGICIRTVDDEIWYAAAMHELGHLLSPGGHLPVEVRQETVFYEMNAMEQAAWDWAEKHALDWTPTMEHSKQLALSITHDTYFHLMTNDAAFARWRDRMFKDDDHATAA